MGLLLRIVAGPDEGKSFPLVIGELFEIGRGVDTQTKLHDPRVSRNHCSLQVREDEVLLVDAGSTGGTFVNGQRVGERLLKSGDIVRVGGTQLQFVGDEGDTLRWAAQSSSLPSTDLMETKEMKRLPLVPDNMNDEETHNIVAPTEGDPENNQ